MTSLAAFHLPYYFPLISFPYTRSIPARVTSQTLPDFLYSPFRNPFLTRPRQFCLRASDVFFHRSAASSSVITSSNSMITIPFLIRLPVYDSLLFLLYQVTCPEKLPLLIVRFQQATLPFPPVRPPWKNRIKYSACSQNGMNIPLK